jgi:hypothetical protein
MGRACSTYGIEGMHTGFWWEKQERPLATLRRRWEGKIEMGLREIGCGVMDWIDLAQDRNQWMALVYKL